ncbi:MAG: hypothetical protein II844_01105 [Prevotella sp.]|nr:hypothetical protein [Prevotella sp.]MBR6191281.1 hypothetical protein [Prevotella sp.]
MKEKTRNGLLGILITTGLTLLCGLAYALKEKINDIDINIDADENEKF